MKLVKMAIKDFSQTFGAGKGNHLSISSQLTNQKFAEDGYGTMVYDMPMFREVHIRAILGIIMHDLCA